MGRALILDGSAAELVGGVERRDLVALRQRRVVEDRLEEVVDPAPQGQHRWPIWTSSVAPLPMMWTPRSRRSSRWKSILKRPLSSPRICPRAISRYLATPVS